MKYISFLNKYYSSREENCGGAGLKTMERYLQSTIVRPYLSYSVLSANFQNFCLFTRSVDKAWL